MEHKRKVVEFLIGQEPVQVLLNEAMAIYFEADRLWISGVAGRYAWSGGGPLGMKGEAEPVTPGDYLAAEMHQGNVAACFNMDAGFHITEVRYSNGSGQRMMIFKLAKTSILGPGELVELAFNPNTRKFEAYAGE